jgi:carbamoyl-phosphate synthase large subunit
MNVLLSCAGRAASLVRYFQDSLGTQGLVIACDSSQSSPALAAATHTLVVPEIGHPDYLSTLLSICEERQIRLLISVHDVELGYLAESAERFRRIGTIPVVSSPEVVARCYDKWQAFQWLRFHGIPTPNTFVTLQDAMNGIERGELRLPVVIKPRYGSRSVGIEYAETRQELELAHHWASIRHRRHTGSTLPQGGSGCELLIQEYIKGQEYGLDVLNDLQGRYAATLCRRKLAMRDGNTDRAVTVDAPELEELGESIGRHLGHVGNLDCDVMMAGDQCYVLDLNPRFGGGYPFSHLAGANIPAILIAWARGQAPDASCLRSRPGVMASKYDSLVVLEAGESKGAS